MLSKSQMQSRVIERDSVSGYLVWSPHCNRSEVGFASFATKGARMITVGSFLKVLDAHRASVLGCLWPQARREGLMGSPRVGRIFAVELARWFATAAAIVPTVWTALRMPRGIVRPR
jgi:hypothetical protein